MPVLIVRFPDGTKEFRYPERRLEVGDVIWHEGTRYRVVSVSEDAGGDQLTVTVERDAETIGDMLDSEEGALVLDPVE